MLFLLATAVPDALGSADRVSSGLETGPIRYIAALSLVVNAVLFFLLMRAHAKAEDRAEKLGAIVQENAQAMAALDKAVTFVTAQLPRKKGPGGLGAEPISGIHPVVKP